MGKVIDLKGYRKTPMYPPVFESRQDSRQTVANDEYGDRLQRIRVSLEKINRLMAELKGMSDG